MPEARFKILAVDDDRTAAMLFDAIGRRYGFDVYVVGDCQAAIAALQTAQFDVILMDWRLPGEMDGMQCVRLIRKVELEQHNYTPIIAVTAYAMKGDRETCLAAGCDDYASKPFNMDELNDKVQYWAKKIVRFPDEKTGYSRA